ncbi:MAG: hypothetical protein H7232_06590 [Aeromicrobium sp.]|nr:hypothetical protein [Burkholderiales bacterium]
MGLDTARLRTIEQVEAFMLGTAAVGFSPSPESERDAWIARVFSKLPTRGATFASVAYCTASLRASPTTPERSSTA